MSFHQTPATGWVFPFFGLAALAMVIGVSIMNADASTEEREDRRERTNAVIEETYGLDILTDRVVSDEAGDLTDVKVKLDGDILTCDVLTETVGFTVTCDSPDGRITLKEK